MLLEELQNTERTPRSTFKIVLQSQPKDTEMPPNTKNSLNNSCSMQSEISSCNGLKACISPASAIDLSNKNTASVDLSLSDEISIKESKISPSSTSTTIPITNTQPVDTLTNGYAPLNYTWPASHGMMTMSPSPPYPSASFYSPAPYSSPGFPFSHQPNPWGLSTSAFPTDSSTGGIVTNTLQILYSIQSVIISLGQVVQIIGSNTSALDHLYQQCNSLVISWWKKMENLSSRVLLLDSSTETSRHVITRQGNEEKRRRRMKAIKYGLMLCASMLGYRWARFWWSRRAEYIRYLEYSHQCMMQPERKDPK